MANGVKDGPEAYVATALDSEPGATAASTPRAIGTPREDGDDVKTLAADTFVGGRYRIVRFIARGGMGEVYEAFDEELRVAVALKLASKTTGKALDRFRREVMLARRVTHRNVCRLFEIGFETFDGVMVPYCTMELLEGETLAARLERGRMSLADARVIIEQLVAGLQAAHDVGVIHRDFKSNNILLVKDGDGRERAVISDFGLARAEEAVVGDGSALTADSSLVGTPAYMAPEQVECKPATAASDIYALGVVMFELVTGDLPFRAETPMATAVRRLTEAPPSPRERRPDLPAGWEHAILRCLAVAPEERFASARAVVAALDETGPRRRVVPWLLAGAVVAGGIATSFTVRSHTERAPAAAMPHTIPGHARGVVIVDPTAGDSWRGVAAGELLRGELRLPGAIQPLDGDETAPLARQLATAKDTEARKAAIVRIGAVTTAQLLVTGELYDRELRVQLVDLASGAQIEEYREPIAGDALAPSLAKLGARLRSRLAGADVPLDVDQTAKVLPADPGAVRAYAEGLAHARAHDHQHAIEALERATSIAQDFGPAYLVLAGELRAVRQQAKAATAAEAANSLAGTLRTDQRLRAEALYRESRKEWSQADDLWATLLTANPDDVATAVARAQALLHAGNADRCYEVLDQMRARPAPVGDDPRLDVQAAYCARQAGDFRSGLSWATRADVKATVRGAREPQQAALMLEGEMLADAGEYDRALVALDRAKHLAVALGDAEASIETLRQIGYVLGEQGKVDEATATYQDAIARANQIGDRLSVGIVLSDFGQIQNNPEEALATFKEALAIAKAEGDQRLVVAASLSLANKQDGTGHLEDALATYADVIELAKQLHDEENLATAELNRSDTLMKKDRYADALPAIEIALESYQRRGDEDGVGYALASRGDAYFGLGDLAAARTAYEAALALRTKLGEVHNLAKSQTQLARLDLDEDRGADAVPLARAAVEQRRKEDNPGQLAQDLRTLARALVATGKPDEAVAALAESNRIQKPEPTDASEDALIRGLADPAHATAQLPIIQAAQHAPGCAACEITAQLDEATLELGLGHSARARTLLLQIQRRAKAMRAGNIVARTTRLLAK